MSDEATKVCLSKSCLLAGVPQPIASFGLNRHRTDSLNPYCKPCTRQQVYSSRARCREYKRHPWKRDPKLRVIKALKGGPLQFGALAKAAELSFDELSDLLPDLCGSERELPILSRNGTGPRHYFLKPHTETNGEFAQGSPSSSFSTPTYCFPVIKGGSGGKR